MSPTSTATSIPAPAETLSFGALLKQWRGHRRMSQLQLAVASGISQRHISFLETGRAQPSRRTILDLADTLDVPLRERNALLLRAGFSALYNEQPLAQAELGLFREALDQMLLQHEPYPALILDGRWNLVSSNTGALSFFSKFIDMSVLARAFNSEDPDQAFPLVQLCMNDNGLKPYLENWQEVTYTFLQRARSALLANPMDRDIETLIRFLQNHPDAPESWLNPSWNTAPPPAITMQLRKDGRQYALFTVLAHFGAPQQVTSQELSVELFFPADEATRAALTAND
ncbi:MAG: helix-turn-helix domain-containing protein [Pseudomonadales bacterium]